MEYLEEPPAELEEIARRLFSAPPQPPKSICLQIDNEVEGDPETVLQEMLTIIAVLGIRRLWGKDFSFDNPEQMRTLDAYMRSLGFQACVARGINLPTGDTVQFRVRFEPI